LSFLGEEARREGKKETPAMGRGCTGILFVVDRLDLTKLLNEVDQLV
jgi:hypothetical protein